jgi:hypothetical protein
LSVHGSAEPFGIALAAVAVWVVAVVAVFVAVENDAAVARVESIDIELAASAAEMVSDSFYLNSIGQLHSPNVSTFSQPTDDGPSRAFYPYCCLFAQYPRNSSALRASC